MDPLPLSDPAGPPQGSGRQRPRRCLLQGCERWFCPARPQCRYCSAACRQAAQRWRRWRAQQKYRASPHGRQQRRQQARRYRQQQRSRLSWRQPRMAGWAAGEAAAVGTAVPAGVGKRLHEKSAEGAWHPCDRPGCYVLFPAGSASNPRRFCCVLCRRALRRVLDREARRRRRRRRGLRRPGRRWRPPPRGP
jgi:hypothetical protein